MKKTLTLVMTLILSSIVSQAKSFAKAFESQASFEAYCEKISASTGFSIQRVKNFFSTLLSEETSAYVSKLTSVPVERITQARELATKNGIVAVTTAPETPLTNVEMKETGTAILRNLLATEQLPQDAFDKQVTVIAKNTNIPTWEFQRLYARLQRSISAPVFGTLKKVKSN